MEETLIEETFSNALDERFVRYAYKSLEERALPDARDGLKPSQRRILYSMHDLKLTSNSSTEKCAKITGHCSGNYHPHGDAVVYPTLCRLVQGWNLRYPLLIGQGNFGNIDGDACAAQRYTESKLSKFGELLLEDLSENIVKYELNYNEKLKEPVILPSKFPNLLVNGCEGIAVGWATKILPHNLKEVCNVIIKYIENNNISFEEIIKIMPGPDLPTGGKILGQDGILEYYKTGRGKITIEGSYSIDKNFIEINELPYQASPDDLCQQIESLVDGGKINGISDLKNLSSKKNGIKILIETAKNSNINLIINQIIKNTCLRQNYSVNQTVLIDGKVVPEANLFKLIKSFLDHRFEVLKNKFNYELKKSKERLHIVNGLINACKNIQRIIDIVMSSKDSNESVEKLISEKIVEDKIQAEYVLSITLRQLNKLENDKFVKEKQDLENSVVRISNIVSTDKNIYKEISTELKEISNKWGDDRKTVIEQSLTNIEDEDLIPDESIVLTLTGDGYLKSINSDNYRLQNRGGIGSIGFNKNEDAENIFDLFELNNKDNLLFFTNFGYVYQRKAYQIPKSSKQAKGFHVNNLLDLKDNENVTNVISSKNIKNSAYLIIVTEKGQIKKTEIEEYNTSRKNAGITAINLSDDDKVAFACITDGKKDIFLVTKNGQCVRYNERIISIQGRATKGSRAMLLDSDDSIVQVLVLDSKEEPDILVVTKNGYGKKTSSDEYKLSSNRSVKGYSVIKKQSISKNGEVIGACALHNSENILLMISNGKCIKIGSESVRGTSRTTAGVKLVKLEDNEFVSRCTKVN